MVSSYFAFVAAKKNVMSIFTKMYFQVMLPKKGKLRATGNEFHLAI